MRPPGGPSARAPSTQGTLRQGRTGFRHCDPRFGFLWTSPAQPAARWHGDADGPANYFADTPVGAWAEFLRHEGITEAQDLAGVRRALWVVALPDSPLARPALPAELAEGGLACYPACQAEAQRLRAQGARGLQARSAALRPGAAHGWVSTGLGTEAATTARDGWVWVFYGPLQATGWPAVEAGASPAAVLPLVRPLTA